MEKRQKRLSRAQDAVRFIKFALFSVSAGAIQFGSSAFLFEVVRLPYWPAYLIALILSVVYNFTINRRFTFRSATNYPKAMLKVFGYYCVFTPLSTLWGDGLTGIGWNQYIVLGGDHAHQLRHRVFVLPSGRVPQLHEHQQAGTGGTPGSRSA